MAIHLRIRISDEAASWARRKAAEEHTSVSRLIGGLLEKHMRLNDEYWGAYEQWKQIVPQTGQVPASRRWSRAETHLRRR